MAPKDAAEGGGQGICLYLLDPSVPGWDRDFDGSSPLGFAGELLLPLPLPLPLFTRCNFTKRHSSKLSTTTSPTLYRPHFIVQPHCLNYKIESEP